MKKIKILIILLCLFLTSGCFKRDTMDNINIVTTTYPIEYLVTSLYGYNSNIKSIYPNGVKVNDYSLTPKQVKEYSLNDMFIYNGLTSEKQVAASFLNKNDSLKLIDVSKGLSISENVYELWLCPSNYLMLAQNVKNGLLEYINSTVLTNEVNDKYDELKLTISKYDANLKKIADNADNKTLIVGNDTFKFLSKYGFNVLSVEDSDQFNQIDYMNAKNAITEKKNKYIYVIKGQKIDENIKTMIEKGAKKIEIDSMINLTDAQVADNVTYITLMNKFLDSIKEEAYE